MPLIRLNSNHTFIAEVGSTILDAVKTANFSLPYSCRTGRCSTCKCRLIEGETSIVHPEIGLSESEKANGWVLSCSRSAVTDLTIEVSDLVDIELPTVKILPCRIHQMTRLAPDVLQVTLRLPPTAEFKVIPGQYIDVIGVNGLRRSYSVANSKGHGFVELHIRAVDGGAMSQYWFHDAKLNDLLRIQGPYGTFFLRETSTVNIVFLATGTGIAPIKAMLESIQDLSAHHKPESVTVLWGGRTPKDLYLDLMAISSEVSYIPVLSRRMSEWAGKFGYVQDVLAQLVPSLDQYHVYACGSEKMIKSAKNKLMQVGLLESNFYSDAFVSSGSN